MAFPLGYYAVLQGEYVELRAARGRLQLLGVLALVAIVILLRQSFDSWRLATLSFLTLPSALVGGVLAAWLAGGVISLGSLVGFLTVLGIAAHDGAFAEQLALPDGNLLPVPDGVSDDAAVFTEPLAAALHLADDVDLRAHRKALVAGDGKLGLLCAHALALHGCDVTVAGRRSPRSLYRTDFATFEADSVYRQRDAEGFINLNALRLKIQALRDRHA